MLNQNQIYLITLFILILANYLYLKNSESSEILITEEIPKETQKSEPTSKKPESFKSLKDAFIYDLHQNLSSVMDFHKYYENSVKQAEIPDLPVGYNINQRPISKNNQIFYPNSQKKILILAQHRAGSTFFSSIVNYHSKVFYSFEPLYFMEHIVPEKITSDLSLWPIDFRNERMELQKSILQNYYQNCQIPAARTGWCEFDGFCFRYMHEALISPPFCDLKDRLKRKCPASKSQISLAHEICKRYEFLAAKTIRVQSISKLPEFLLNDLETGNLKIIILLRDPRSIVNSRFNCKSQTGPGLVWDNSAKNWWKISTVCNVYKSIVDELKTSSKVSENMKRNIRFARYEDLVSSPEQTMKYLYYNFLDLPETESQTAIEKLSNEIQTTNSKSYINKWINGKKMNWRVVETIQNSCGEDFMRKFGYNVVGKDDWEDLSVRGNFEYVDRAGCAECWN